MGQLVIRQRQKIFIRSFRCSFCYHWIEFCLVPSLLSLCFLKWQVEHKYMLPKWNFRRLVDNMCNSFALSSIPFLSRSVYSTVQFINISICISLVWICFVLVWFDLVWFALFTYIIYVQEMLISYAKHKLVGGEKNVDDIGGGGTREWMNVWINEWTNDGMSEGKLQIDKCGALSEIKLRTFSICLPIFVDISTCNFIR